MDGYQLGDYAVRAGTDMFLSPMGYMGRFTELTTNTASGIAALRNAAKHQLFVYVNSACIGEDTSVSYNTAWVAMPVVLSIVLLGSSIAIFALMVKPAFFPSKKKKSVE